MRTGWIKRTVSAFALLCLVFGLTAPASAREFTDVSAGDWYAPAVAYMSEKGYMVGTSATEFSPESTLSRAEFVTTLYRLSGETAKGESAQFTDVPQGTWYTEAVAWAVENNITTGSSATTFSPGLPVSREQMAVFLKRFEDSHYDYALRDEKKIAANTVSPANVTQVYLANDADASSDWALDSVHAANYRRLLLTDGNGNIRPRANATRKDAAAAFYNLLQTSGGSSDPRAKEMTLTQQTTGDFADLNKEFIHNRF